MHKNMLRRAAVLPALMAAMLLAGLIGPATAHTGEFHATAVAEGGSTKFIYDIPGVDPPQEFWLDAMTSIKHRVDVNGKDWYRASFKVNSWKGVFSEDDSIWAAPGDAMATDYTIRVGLYLRDTNTGILTQLSQFDGFTTGTGGNGWSYGCLGDGREVQVNPQATKEVVASLWVWANRKYWSQTYLQWRNVPYGQGYNQTRSYRMGTVHVQGVHGMSTDPMTGFFVSGGSSPNSGHRGSCPLWTTVS